MWLFQTFQELFAEDVEEEEQGEEEEMGAGRGCISKPSWDQLKELLGDSNQSVYPSQICSYCFKSQTLWWF